MASARQKLPQHWVDELRMAGIEVQWFRREVSPFTLRRSQKRRLFRLHRKLAVMDVKWLLSGASTSLTIFGIQRFHRAGWTMRCVCKAR
jgi:hypothetical protein